MKIEQFEDKNLSHYSYAILSECQSEIILIDPSRDTTPYLQYASEHHARIIGVIETHPHADFVSSHLELHRTLGATIYCSKLVAADYPHKAFDQGDEIEFGKIKLKALNTPGHSPDSISVVLEHWGKDHAVFTGDTLFIGDCGRPDLRENTGNIKAVKEELAGKMYHSLREQLMVLEDDVLVYPAHGAGTLCGKVLSKANSSTIGAEKKSNWSLQSYTEEDFIKELISEQSFVPKYFPYNVTLNKQGAETLSDTLSKVPVSNGREAPAGSVLIIDTRPESIFKAGHIAGAINLQDSGKFETWLGSIVAPGEPYDLIAASEEQLKNLILRTAKIGYESFIRSAIIDTGGIETTPILDLDNFTGNIGAYTIVDVRNTTEAIPHPVFQQALNIPLHQLRERINEIPLNKPIVVHCAGGTRSAAGSSIIDQELKSKVPVFDLGKAVKDFK
jgi:hydroxyacylglutathione hydrolase